MEFLINVVASTKSCCRYAQRPHHLPVQLMDGCEHTRALLCEFGMSPPQTSAELEAACGNFADPFLRYLGAEEITSLDASEDESATVIHEMNLPIPSELKRRFDVVYDGGSLEHIFNFPVAVQNCIEMVRVGGHFLGANPTNNRCGHGFCQFSPELCFRIFSMENGFSVDHAVVYESAADHSYEVEDPERVRQRMLLSSAFPVSLVLLARKADDVPVLRNTPQQSDYSLLWQGQPLAEGPREAPLKLAVKHGLAVAEQVLPACKNLFDKIRRFRYRRNVVQRLMTGLHSPFLKRVTDVYADRQVDEIARKD